MITRDNFKAVLGLISEKDKRRILKTDKEYVVLYLYTFNVGSIVEVTLTNDYIRYQNVSNNGNCILETNYVVDELIDLLTDEHVTALLSGKIVEAKQMMKNYTEL